MFVMSDYRHVGLGTRLLGAAFDYAREQGLSRILLHPTERAMPLYRRTGFARADQYFAWSASADSQSHQLH
ncbi:GNAT family N-acetyltransferase [Actinopolymorpha sp. B9G3]|uniref:GNAT family N-acetyltransferase n=1 Tax=Actinopolymorpha sp. B9G3 TaxID=3158970 RepID=UPI0032D9A9DD